MERNHKKNQLLVYYTLMRLDKPIGSFLLLWPSLWALWIATDGFPPIWVFFVFFINVWLMRSAGCVLNDYIDRNFDGYVKRTANRPLSKGTVTGKEACILFLILVIFAFLFLLTLNKNTIVLSIITLILICIYPFMKRYINLPQVVLGVVFSCPIPIAFSAVNQSLSLICWLMFLANIFWVISYDTQYAMVDRDDDLKIGIKSSAILFGCHDKLIIGILQFNVLILMALIGYLNSLNWKFYCAVLIAGLLFIYQQKLILYRERNACFKAFMNNNYVGLVLFLGIVLGYLFP